MKHENLHIIQLIESCINKQRSAYYELYTLYYKTMYNSALRILKNTTDAEDVMQEAFITAFGKLHTFRSMNVEENVAAQLGMWLKRIVINNSINYIRKNNKYIFNDLENISNVIDEPANEDFQQEEVQQVLQIIQTLKPNYRVALTLHLIEGYDYEEIMGIMGLSYQNVRTIVSRAKNKVAELIEVQKQTKTQPITH